jgi:hypothetical protein
MPKQGYITPSGFKDMMTGGKGGEAFGLTALKYADKVALSTFGIREEEPAYTTKEMQWGIDYEGYAEQAYSSATLSEIARIGANNWIQHPVFPFVGGHVDGGYVGSDGLIEIKCPYNPHNHLENLRTAKQYGALYKPQVQGYLWISGRKWLDFVSYDPRFEDIGLELSITRVERDDVFISELEARALAFWEIIQTKCGEIEALRSGK